MINEALAKTIDHTLLKPEAANDQIRNLCDEALKHGFASVCVNPCYVRMCVDRLKDSSVKVCTVAGFPLGANTMEIKICEAMNSIENGAQEIDMVINIGMLKSRNLIQIEREILGVARTCHEHKVLLKVIIEACLLTQTEKSEICLICRNTGADYIKTSTGLSTGGATVADVRLLKELSGDSMLVKAAGGIRDRKTALAMIAAGASRIGTSSGVKIMSEK
jgi:deoxyribose-phosphate aldolase